MRREKQFFRSCSICTKLIGHTTERVKNQAEQRKSPCASCVKRSMWANPDSPLRSPETCAKRAAGISRAHSALTAVNKTFEYKHAASERRRAAHANPKSAYSAPEYREHLSIGVRAALLREDHGTKRQEYKQKLRDCNTAYWTAERRTEHREKLWKIWCENDSFPWNFHREGAIVSALELRCREALRPFGFVHSSERTQRQLGRFTPDFVHVQLPLVLEIFGDFWHHNPQHSIFGKPEWTNPYTKRTSTEQWVHDARRISSFAELGHETIVIWEADIVDI